MKIEDAIEELEKLKSDAINSEADEIVVDILNEAIYKLVYHQTK